MELTVNKEFVNAIAEKFGMFIDWTSDNVVPQVMDILMRYRMYEIVNNSIFVVVGLILVIVGLIYSIKFLKELHTTYDDFPEGKAPYQNIEKRYTAWRTTYDGEIRFDDMSVGGLITIILSVSAIITGFIFFGDSFMELIKWLIIPEIQFYNLFIGA